MDGYVDDKRDPPPNQGFNVSKRGKIQEIFADWETTTFWGNSRLKNEIRRMKNRERPEQPWTFFGFLWRKRRWVSPARARVPLLCSQHTKVLNLAGVATVCNSAAEPVLLPCAFPLRFRGYWAYVLVRPPTNPSRQSHAFPTLTRCVMGPFISRRTTITLGGRVVTDIPKRRVLPIGTNGKTAPRGRPRLVPLKSGGRWG